MVWCVCVCCVCVRLCCALGAVAMLASCLVTTIEQNVLPLSVFLMFRCGVYVVLVCAVLVVCVVLTGTRTGTSSRQRLQEMRGVTM